jgi:hypothetical protein
MRGWQKQGGAGEEERRRDEGTRKRAKEVARTAGGKAAGARVDRRMRRRFEGRQQAARGCWWKGAC